MEKRIRGDQEYTEGLTATADRTHTQELVGGTVGVATLTVVGMLGDVLGPDYHADGVADRLARIIGGVVSMGAVARCYCAVPPIAG